MTSQTFEHSTLTSKTFQYSAITSNSAFGCDITIEKEGERLAYKTRPAEDDEFKVDFFS